MLFRFLILLLFCFISCASSANEKAVFQDLKLTSLDRIPQHSAQRWQQITLQDIAGIHLTLKQDHPGALSEVGDRLFMARLQQGYFLARQQAKKVSNYDEYRAVLNTYTASFNDLHVASFAAKPPKTQLWPGFIVNLVDDRWIVNDTAANLGLAWPVALPIRGMELSSCDGVSVNDWAVGSVGTYLADWSSEAQRERFSSYLFIGEKGIKQFSLKPVQCTFIYKFQKLVLDIRWQSHYYHQLRQYIFKQPVRSSAGFGMEKVGNGYWVSLAALDGEVEQVVTQLETQIQLLRQSDFVVLDLRGNSGGDTSYAHRIALAIYGQDYVGPAIGWPYVDVLNQESYRVSANNVLRLKDHLEKAKQKYPQDEQAIKLLDSNYQAVKLALEQGKELAPFVAKAQRRVLRLLPARDVAAKFNGQVLVLTDSACFGSCLLMTDLFLRLGAKQIGRITNYMPRYYDTKQSLLPSGISKFITTTKVDFAAPKQLGPFKPVYGFDGNMNDKVQLQKWVLGLVASDRD